MRCNGHAYRLADRDQSGRRGRPQQHASGRSVTLKIADRPGKQALAGRDKQDADENCEARTAKHNPEVMRERCTPTAGDARLDTLGKKWAKEAVGRPAYQHEHVEQGEAHRDTPGAHPGYARRISERADEIYAGSQQADDDKLAVHFR
jgi:hypothetical protein